MVHIIPFSELSMSDLIIDAVYEGGNAGNTSDDPLSKLLPGTGNQGGFRASGQSIKKKFVTLYTSGENKDWPDNLNIYTGQFVYYGDNKTAGRELHDTQPGGNRILRHVFELLHSSDRREIPPFFIFQKYPTANSSRSVQFKGIAVPGFPGLTATEDLVAVWKSTKGERFQNYRSIFTVLDIAKISRAWISDLTNNDPFSANANPTWIKWIDSGSYTPLTAEPTTIIRSQAEQTPETVDKMAVLTTIWHHFKDSPISFELFAARIFQMHDQRVIIDEITQASVDGGRDAIGRYLLGLGEDPVYAEFSLEAKCYRPPIDGATPNTVGVKEVSRLISRIRNRQFGVLVTTSVVGRQAYEEVRDDRHPVIFISGKDIANILFRNGYNTTDAVKAFLESEFKA